MLKLNGSHVQIMQFKSAMSVFHLVHIVSLPSPDVWRSIKIAGCCSAGCHRLVCRCSIASVLFSRLSCDRLLNLKGLLSFSISSVSFAALHNKIVVTDNIRFLNIEEDYTLFLVTLLSCIPAMPIR